LLAASLDGQECDSGTAAEVGFAAALGITCFALRSDRRETGERGTRTSLQLEAFIVQSGGAVVESLDQLVRALEDTARTSSGSTLTG
jgi:nucleoside 2-deoxyribosyltransferase